MIVGHFSDLHGWLAPLLSNEREPDLWISTGDQLREDPARPMSKQPAVQHSWLLKHMDDFKKVFKDKPVLIVNGNHEWIDPVPFLREASIDARAVKLAKQGVFGLTYAGFPFIPPVENPALDVYGKKIRWNYERFAGEMQEMLDGLITLEESPDLLITHCPPHSILDTSAKGRSYGIESLTPKLMYAYHNIRYHFFGHIHASAGVDIQAGIVFSNASCRLQFIEVK